jgi:Plavaka transposase
MRRKPSNRAYVLLAYPPTTRLENISNKAARRRQLANLYHACMGRVLEPLKLAGVSGIFMATGDGSVHRNHPLLACFSLSKSSQRVQKPENAQHVKPHEIN